MPRERANQLCMQNYPILAMKNFASILQSAQIKYLTQKFAPIKNVSRNTNQLT